MSGQTAFEAASAALPDTERLSPAEEKRNLRKEYKARRAARSPEERARLDAALCAAVIGSELFADAEAILLYAPIRGEIDVLPIAQAAWRAGKTVAFPRVTGPRQMSFHTVGSPEELVCGYRGIPEPPENAPPVSRTAGALLLVPALCYDKTGYRLGYGGGYYDAFLTAFSGQALGVCYAEDIIPALPHEAHDFALALLTDENGIQILRK